VNRIVERFAGGRLPTLISNGALLAGGMLASVWMARTLGPVGRGEYVTWQATSAAIAIFAIGGLPQAIVLDRTSAGRHHLRDVGPALASTMSTALAVVLVVAVVLGPDPLLITGMALVIAANQLAGIGPSEAQRVGHMGLEFNAMRLAPQAAALFAIGLMTVVGDRTPVHWLVFVAGCQTVAMVAVTGYALRGPAAVVARHRKRPAGGFRGPLAAPRRAAPEISGRTWRLFLANFATQVQYRFDLIAVAMVFPHATVAFYAVGVASQAAVLAMGQASGMYWFSRRPAGGRLRGELMHAMAFACAAALPLAGLSALWVPAVYGSEFVPAVPVVALLCLAGVAQSVDYLLVQEVLRTRNARTLLTCRLPGLVSVVTAFLLARWFHLPVSLLGFAPMMGYAVSAAAFLFVVGTKAPDRVPVSV
jgi:O-antigen/teichoic acid export membrane protein